jgi:hypothetical protein
MNLIIVGPKPPIKVHCFGAAIIHGGDCDDAANEQCYYPTAYQAPT